MQGWSAFSTMPANTGTSCWMFLGARLTVFRCWEGTRSVIFVGAVLEATKRGNQRVSRAGDVPET